MASPDGPPLAVQTTSEFAVANDTMNSSTARTPTVFLRSEGRGANGRNRMGHGIPMHTTSPTLRCPRPPPRRACVHGLEWTA
eukprot:11159958-Lingulodinium_polyedra.AAC.1